VVIGVTFQKKFFGNIFSSHPIKPSSYQVSKKQKRFFKKCPQIVLETKITNFKIPRFWSSQVNPGQAKSSQHTWFDIKAKSSQGSPSLACRVSGFKKNEMKLTKI
jgi:hypothetical protein